MSVEKVFLHEKHTYIFLSLHRALDELRRGESDHIRENDVAVLQLK